MGVRSDFSLDLQLKYVHEQVANDDVKRVITSALEHMRSGRGGHRKGGRVLVQLLGAARGQAAELGEWGVVRLLQDSIDYAEGRILQPDFDERYRLFQDGARNEGLLGFVAGMLEIKFNFAADAGRRYLEEHPDAGAEGLLAHIDSLSHDARYLVAPGERPGRYSLIRGRAEKMIWLERVLQERIDIDDPEEAAQRIAASPEAWALLAADPEGQMILRAAQLQKRSARLAALRKVAEDEAATELDLQRALEGQYWIFGGRFVGEAAQRRLVPGDEIDIPLIRGDGSLHIVELKRAMSMTGALVKRHRGAWVPTAHVHDAVGQAVNYLVGLDEDRRRIFEDFSIETRRASAIVLIGHPALQPDVPEQEINEALRTFNTHVNRVEVITYKELIDNAERSLGGSV
ncbi:Shedu anti-phage system protein SduA domain-containing protein [Kitasatospora mediocidica]|uniref:Shedu anti-phage system protein SduA domain-containing protein n=1 Tax=Kitasatospora mediocidica TaxID=58352 RepID=UPI00055F11B4|nr:Shedu anti-phage system protein SduA domain-containing protein [Kitasatospora mediocidica]